MSKKPALYLAVVVSAFFACKKDPVVTPPADSFYSITLNNEYNLLQARLVVFLSDESGAVKAYRELPGSDTARLEVPGSSRSDRFDCTIVKIITVDAPGSGLRDTLIYLTTYINLPDGEIVNLRNPVQNQTTDLNVTFTGVTSVDSVIVPDGLTFVRPQSSNNFYGQYRVLHTGKLWLRVRVNGESMWRFILFDNVTTPTLDATLDANLLLPIFAAPKKITLPFTAAWEYNVDGIVDTAARKFLAMGDLIRAPGGAVPVYGSVDIFEPVSNDVFDPGPKPYKGFRIRLKGTGPVAGGYTYILDRFSADIPATVPVPAFDLQPTVLSDNRLVATQCIGNFDALVFSRHRSGTPNITWEVHTAPAAGVVAYRLPDVPDALGNQFAPLKKYDFGGQVTARAENYDNISSYELVLRRRLLNDDPLWQAKAGYLGKEEVQ